MKKITLLLLTLLASVFTIDAQVVTTAPAFPTQDEAVEIIFDASQGAGGLKGYTGDVYAHTGVITDKSTSDADWKYATSWPTNTAQYKLISLGNNKWKLTISSSIRAYYGVPAIEQIKKMTFVFRNELGSIVGKDVGDKDILINVFEEGINVSFSSPVGSQLIAKNTSLTFVASASSTTDLKLLIDKTEIASASATTSIAKDYTFTTEGPYWAIVEAGTSPNTVRDSIFVNVKKAQLTEPKPATAKYGANVIDDNTVTFVLYAPQKLDVFLIGDFNNWQANNDFMMKKDGDYWWITLNNLEKGKEYAYQYLVDGSLKIADPYTDKILDPNNDQWIEVATYPNLKPYPAGKTEGIVSIVQTGQTSYNWKIENFAVPAREKMVIYELLIRDFTEEHTFESTMQKLDYLQTLGVNVVELLPVNEFEGNNSWGYNPSFYFAVDKFYGTKDSFKAFVDECHRRGMAVVIDMVLNHSFGQSPFAQLYWDKANNRPAVNNPWYNTVSPNTAYSWGSDFNHESAQTKALVDSVNSYWIKEYKVDGFRFDFTKGFTNTPGDGQAYDNARVDILTRMSDEIYKRKSDAIVIFEHLADYWEETTLSKANIMLWGNMNHNYLEAIMGWTELEKTDLEWALQSKRGLEKSNLVAYMESHDEERMMFKALSYGAAGVKANLEGALKRAALSAAFYIPLPGPKMIWQFGELGYDYSIDYCEDGTIGGCRVDPKPIRWDYLDVTSRKALYDTYAKLANLKQNNDVFNSDDIYYSLNGGQKHFVWKSENVNAFLVGNFDVTSKMVNLTLPKSGKWYNPIDDTTLEMSGTAYSETLQAGEFRLYMDKDIVVGIEKPSTVSQTIIIKDGIAYLSGRASQVDIYNINGTLCKQKQNTDMIDVLDLNSGMYILKAQDMDGISILKFVKKY